LVLHFIPGLLVQLHSCDRPLDSSSFQSCIIPSYLGCSLAGTYVFEDRKRREFNEICDRECKSGFRKRSKGSDLRSNDQIQQSIELNSNEISLHIARNILCAYDALTVNDSGLYQVPAKIKIFLWLMLNNAVLTKDNMVKRKWPGDPTFYFCNHNESLSHLFFQCSTAKAVWAIIVKCIDANNVPRSFDQC